MSASQDLLFVKIVKLHPQTALFKSRIDGINHLLAPTASAVDSEEVNSSCHDPTTTVTATSLKLLDSTPAMNSSNIYATRRYFA